ncbi:MAG: hypothetical protein Q7J34_08215 [Bacteroidales bacterium]|nr:hypothetical protein [Bacteroidales bacterium]
MKIAVCISNVPDTTTKIKFNASMTSVDYSGVQWIINPWDELALTRAVELKEISGGNVSSVDVICVGDAGVEPTLRKCLAIGAEKAIRIQGDPSDGFGVASMLADYFAENSYHLILAGLESSDFNGGYTGSMLAGFLDIALITAVSGISLENSKFKFERDVDGASQTVEADGTTLAVIQKGFALQPRIPSMRGIMSARTKSLQVIQGTESTARTQMVSFEMPKSRAACKFVEPDNVSELVNLLHNEAKVI